MKPLLRVLRAVRTPRSLRALRTLPSLRVLRALRGGDFTARENLLRLIAAVALTTGLLAPIGLLGDVGVLIPSGSTEPNPSMLALDEMHVDVSIDNGDARVAIRKIFASRVGQILEGEYLFAMPGRAVVSDFAVWDGVTRIPGVILERRRAGEIYDSLKQQQIDPGLLQQGEQGTEGASEASRTSAFSARIVPIPGFGTKRLEMEYHESIPVENLKSVFSLPLRPTAYRAQSARELTLNFDLKSAHAIAAFRGTSASLPLTTRQQTPHEVSGSFAGRNVTFSEDFAVEYALDAARVDTLEVLTYRDAATQPGFFQATALMAPAEGGDGGRTLPTRTIVALFDASLSMQWEKLERSYRTLEALLASLRPSDHFNVVVFNSEIASFAPAPVAAERGAVDRALTFVRAGRLRGGTDLERALAAGLAQTQLAGGDRYLVLLGDASATAGTIANAPIASAYDAQRTAIPAGQRPRTYVFGIGEDANVPLLKMLTREDGLMETLRSTEPLEFKMNAFVSKIGARPLEGVQLTVDPAASVDMVYQADPVSFAGSTVGWVGRYQQPRGSAAFTARGVRDGRPVQMRTTAALPAEATEHDGLPRAWARARVDALLDKIARDGEDRASVDEIVALSRRYKFVTPYTSFLAAPRALLRPRVIKPGDPILRVATDESIASVVAIFPFGLVKKLRYLEDERIWQTRFLAPSDMNDGTYQVRLVMRDRAGHAYREEKSFVIASRPPALRVSVDRASARPGETVTLRAQASASTRTIVARLSGAVPVDLRWDAKAAANIGALVVPEGLPAGQYTITITAEDIAHNVASREIKLDVLP